MKRTFRVALVLSVLASTLSIISMPTVTAVVATNPTPNCSAGSTCTIAFPFTNDFYSWTVPSGNSSVTVDIQGAQGGGMSNGTLRGKGGRVQATLSVSAGTVLNIYVGGSGANSNTSAQIAAGGWNGGGTGGNYSTSGGGGGGASDIRIGGTGLANRRIVAGGAGGFGYNGPNTAGGHGGGLKAQWVGIAGSTGCVTSTETSFLNEGVGCESPSGSVNFGRGGSQTSGGDTTATADKGFAGALGIGGNGGTGSSQCGGPCPGGGGGGGYYGGGGGGAGPGGGGSSFTDSNVASSVTHTRGFRTGDGQVFITYLNAPQPTTFSTTQISPTNISAATTVTYSLILSQSVSDLTASDFQFGGTSTCNTPELSGSTNVYTVTLTNCTEGTLILQLKAGSITGTSSGPPSISSANTVVIDRTLPTISFVTAPANKTYIPAETSTFTMAFSESVTVTGTPRLTLTVGAQTRFANYLFMTDSRTALFRYTVASNLTDFDTDGISISSNLDLNSGTIRDLATNTLTNLGFAAPILTSVFVAQPPAAPTITSITPSNGALSVAFTAGAANGSAITNYQFSTNNGVNWGTRSPVATTSPISITGLTNGQSYNVRLRAINGAGNGESTTAVAATPSAVVVTGDTTLSSTYGQVGSTGTYSATGGTGGYTFSLSETPTGVTINPSNGTVTTATTTLAGTYTQSVRATDSSAQIGTRSLTITVNKATTSITIALPNSSTSAALGGAVTITATVPRAGAVNFRLAGTTLAGCGAAAAASTTATCSWTPLALGSVALTAIFTPADTSNFETSTATTLTITVVNGVSTVSLSLTGGVTQVPKGQTINIIAAIDQIGRITFLIDGKRIPGCNNLLASVIGNRTCSWKPSVQKAVNISARLVPTNNVFNPSVSNINVQVTRRTGPRG